MEELFSRIPRDKHIKIALIDEHWAEHTKALFQAFIPKNIEIEFIQTIPLTIVNEKLKDYNESFVFHSIDKFKQYTFEEDLLKVLWLAKRNPTEKYVYIGFGAENRASSTAAATVKLQMAGLNNLKIYNNHFSVESFITNNHYDKYIINEQLWPFIANREQYNTTIISGNSNLDIAQSIKLATQDSNKTLYQSYEASLVNIQSDSIKFRQEVYPTSENNRLVVKDVFKDYFI